MKAIVLLNANALDLARVVTSELLVTGDNLKRVFEMQIPVELSDSPSAALQFVFCALQRHDDHELPAGYRARSVSMGDVITLCGGSEYSYLVAADGFIRLPFLLQESGSCPNVHIEPAGSVRPT